MAVYVPGWPTGRSRSSRQPCERYPSPNSAREPRNLRLPGPLSAWMRGAAQAIRAYMDVLAASPGRRRFCGDPP